jgi:hypothetical protein
VNSKWKTKYNLGLKKSNCSDDKEKIRTLIKAEKILRDGTEQNELHDLVQGSFCGSDLGQSR